MAKRLILLVGIFLLSFYGQALSVIPDIPISGDIDYKGCRDGDIYVVAFYGADCYGDIKDDTTLEAPGPYTLDVGLGEYSICACMDVDGSGGCGSDETEPRGRYPEPLNIESVEGLTDIDIELIDPVPCPTKTTAVPTLSYAGTIILVLVIIGSAVWFIRRRNKVS